MRKKLKDKTAKFNITSVRLHSSTLLSPLSTQRMPATHDWPRLPH